jgi:hypothetical protein
MTYINLDKEIAESPDHWWLDFPDPARLISKQAVYAPDEPGKYASSYSYSSSNYIRISDSLFSWNTTQTLNKLAWTTDNFHRVFPKFLSYKEEHKALLGWVIQDPDTSEFFVYRHDIPNEHIVVTTVYPLTKKFSYKKSSFSRDAYLVQDKFYKLILKALRARIKLAKKNNPDLFHGLKDSKASVVQLDVMTKFHRLDSKIELFKAKVNSSPDSELYKEDLQDLLVAMEVFSNSVKNPSELKHLKTRPKPKKKK